MRLAVIGMAAMMAVATSTAAQAQTLGVRYAGVRQAYAEAQSVTVGSARALELHDVDYWGFHWKVVDFVFNTAGRLDHLTMSSTDAHYEDVLRAASLQMEQPSGLTTAAAPAGPDLQIRVCEQRGGGVTVTYEAASTIS